MVSAKAFAHTHSWIFPGSDGTTPATPNQVSIGVSRESAVNFKHWFSRGSQAQYPAISSILIVTHAATKIALGMSLLDHQSVNDEITFNGEKTKIRAGACSIDKFVREQDSWALKENGRTDFLKDGEEMNWNLDVKFEAGSDEDIKARKEAAKLAGVSEPPSKIGPDIQNDSYEVRKHGKKTIP